ncbi:TolC family protein [Woeseia oceani]|uniref:TolC family protein n=1 Tax=Woeseia oceani TaxID=1548547 RepID=A0A193LC02_9GAMM|nr:TolC family protein [Woeseia oceani]ANO49998.1 hypothetical protein BA177_01075 [Woeseia oceani]
MKHSNRMLAALCGGLIMLPWISLAAPPDKADAALSGFIRAVVDRNPRVEAARAALDASDARSDAASRPLYNPTLSFDAEDTDVERTQTIGLSQTIDWADKRGARSDAAAFQREATLARYLSVRRDVIVKLLDGLARYRTGAERERLAAERVEAMNEFAELAGRRFDAGDLSQVDLDLARIAASDARIQKASAAAALAEARQDVRSLVPNSPPDEWPGLDNTLPALPAQFEPEMLVMALPEVRAAQSQVDVASAVVELRQREKRPDPTIGIAGGKEGESNLIGINVTVPLFVRNSFSAEVSAAVADRREAMQIASDIRQRAYARVVSAAERYRAVYAAWQDWRAAGSESLERQGDLVRRLWQSGEISTTDYLVQLRQTLDVRENALELRQSFWRAWFEWVNASGQVDNWLNLQADVQPYKFPEN